MPRTDCFCLSREQYRKNCYSGKWCMQMKPRCMYCKKKQSSMWLYRTGNDSLISIVFCMATKPAGAEIMSKSFWKYSISMLDTIRFPESPAAATGHICGKRSRRLYCRNAAARLSQISRGYCDQHTAFGRKPEKSSGDMSMGSGLYGKRSERPSLRYLHNRTESRICHLPLAKKDCSVMHLLRKSQCSDLRHSKKHQRQTTLHQEITSSSFSKILQTWKFRSIRSSSNR